MTTFHHQNITFSLKNYFTMKIKYIFISLILLFLIQNTHAQEKDFTSNFVIGGQFSFLSQNNYNPAVALDVNSGIGGVGQIYSTSYRDSKNTRFSFAPYLGKQFSPNWMVGARLNLGFSKSTSENAVIFNPIGGNVILDIESNVTNIGLSVISRYTVNPDQALQVYLQPFLAFTRITAKNKEDNVEVLEENINNFELGSAVGLMYHFNDKWAVLMSLGGVSYNRGKSKFKDTTIENDFSAFSARFGLSSIYLGVERKF